MHNNDKNELVFHIYTCIWATLWGFFYMWGGGASIIYLASQSSSHQNQSKIIWYLAPGDTKVSANEDLIKVKTYVQGNTSFSFMGYNVKKNISDYSRALGGGGAYILRLGPCWFSSFQNGGSNMTWTSWVKIQYMKTICLICWGLGGPYVRMGGGGVQMKSSISIRHGILDWVGILVYLGKIFWHPMVYMEMYRKGMGPWAEPMWLPGIAMTPPPPQGRITTSFPSI